LKQRNLSQTTEASNYEAEAKKLQIQFANENKARSEFKENSKMEKKQAIDISVLANTIQNMTVKEVKEEDFEDVPLPGGSSFVPLKTIKKSGSKIKEVVKEEIEEQIE